MGSTRLAKYSDLEMQEEALTSGSQLWDLVPEVLEGGMECKHTTAAMRMMLKVVLEQGQAHVQYQKSYIVKDAGRTNGGNWVRRHRTSACLWKTVI